MDSAEYWNTYFCTCSNYNHVHWNIHPRSIVQRTSTYIGTQPMQYKSASSLTMDGRCDEGASLQGCRATAMQRQALQYHE
eukprot:scaffold52044_cov20-Tisochrysis_lutea.AAC.1